MNHFYASTRRSLARKGIRIIGLQAVPGADGSWSNAETCYKVNDNGCGRVWTFAQVLEAAR